MTNEEKRKLAIQRELIELGKISKAFDQVVADAQRLAAELREATARFEAVSNEAKIDAAIDNLDYLMKRGTYRAKVVAQMGTLFPNRTWQ